MEIKMSKLNDLKRAREVMDSLCRALDAQSWNYNRDDEELVVECGAKGKDLPMPAYFAVNPEFCLVKLSSYLPFEVPEENRVDMAIAVSIVNYRLANGFFDFDIKTGHLYFRMTNSYLESDLGEDIFIYMLFCSLDIVEEYNDKFYGLVTGRETIDNF